MQSAARTVLCIDDSPDILRFRKLLLESRGYHVLTSTNGRQGIRIFQNRPVDGVILDYDMPFLNGAQVAAELKRRRPDVPILMSSGHGDGQPDRAPVDAFVGKDQPNSVLLERLEQLLRDRSPATTAHSSSSLAVVGSLAAATALMLGKAVLRSRRPALP